MAGNLAMIPRGPRGARGPGGVGTPGERGPKGDPGEFTEIIGTYDEIATMTLPNGRSSFRTTGRSTPGDGGGGLYIVRGSEPSGGSRFKSQLASGQWAEMVERNASVLVAGAEMDGSTDDHSAIQQSLDRMFNKFNGGDVILPPSGKPARTTQQLVIPNGVILKGLGRWTYPGSTAGKLAWTQAGTWLAPEHASDSAIALGGHGAGVEDIYAWYDQPTPGPGFSPADLPFFIEVNTSHHRLKQIGGVGVSRGIHYKYTPESGGGTYSETDSIYLNCLRTFMKFDCVNDTASFKRLRARGVWYSSDTQYLVPWLENNYVPFDVGYLDNADFDVVEFFQCKTAMRFRNSQMQFGGADPTLGNNHSYFNATMRGVQFNLVRQAMDVATSDAVVWGTFTDTLLQTDTESGTTTVAMNLASDHVDIVFNGLIVNDAGGEIMRVGAPAGSGGKVAIDGLKVRGWSASAAGQVGFATNNASAEIRIPGRKDITRRGSAGNAYGGAGRFLTDIAPWTVFRDLAAGEGVASGDWQSLPGGYLVRPIENAAQMASMTGSVRVTTAAVSGTVQLRLEGAPEIITTNFDASSTGEKNFTAALTQLASRTNVIGRLQFKASAGVVINRVTASVNFL